MPIGSRSRPPRRPRATRRSLIAALAIATALGGVAVPGNAADPERNPRRPDGLAEFMGGLAEIESGGRYDARNRSSGAYGKYQIMPFNWPAWSKWYLGTRKARQTARNQELVASGRLSDLYWRFGSWDRTAYWWLTGKRGSRPTWSRTATRYVDNVMIGYRMRRNTPLPGAIRRIDDAADSVVYAGAWKIAKHPAYRGPGVHATGHRGAAFAFRFTGRAVRIVGPNGPTRGRAAVYVDGRRVAVVDMGARHFRARALIFAWSAKRRGEHWIEVRALGTPGRPTVAVDRVVIRG